MEEARRVPRRGRPRLEQRRAHLRRPLQPRQPAPPQQALRRRHEPLRGDPARPERVQQPGPAPRQHGEHPLRAGRRRRLREAAGGPVQQGDPDVPHGARHHPQGLHHGAPARALCVLCCVLCARAISSSSESRQKEAVSSSAARSAPVPAPPDRRSATASSGTSGTP